VIKRIEVVANIAVIATSLVVCTVLIRRYVLPSKGESAATARVGDTQLRNSSSWQSSITPGTKIPTPIIDWGKSDRTIVLALSTTCHFCTDSAPFYQKLAHDKRTDVRIVALFPQSVREGRTYLDNLGIKVDEVTQSPLNSVGAVATPTLLLVDRQGTIVDSWVGKLSNGIAEEVRLRVSK
jgi:hypothetical protein